MIGSSLCVVSCSRKMNSAGSLSLLVFTIHVSSCIQSEIKLFARDSHNLPHLLPFTLDFSLKLVMSAYTSCFTSVRRVPALIPVTHHSSTVEKVSMWRTQVFISKDVILSHTFLLELQNLQRNAWHTLN